MATPCRLDHPYARRPSPSRSSAGDDHALDAGEHQIALDEVTITTAPAPSRFHMFTNLARAVCTRVLYMWGSFRHIITPARGPSLLPPFSRKSTQNHKGSHDQPRGGGMLGNFKQNSRILILCIYLLYNVYNN